MTRLITFGAIALFSLVSPAAAQAQTLGFVCVGGLTFADGRLIENPDMTRTERFNIDLQHGVWDYSNAPMQIAEVTNDYVTAKHVVSDQIMFSHFINRKTLDYRISLFRDGERYAVYEYNCRMTQPHDFVEGNKF